MLQMSFLIISALDKYANGKHQIHYKLRYDNGYLTTKQQQQKKTNITSQPESGEEREKKMTDKLRQRRNIMI